MRTTSFLRFVRAAAFVPSLVVASAIGLWSSAPAQQPVPAAMVNQALPVPLGDPFGTFVKQKQIERHGITWKFDRAATVGAFANGDPWVLGPVRIVGITPECVEKDGRVMHGSMIDPDPSQMLQGYDSCLFDDEKRERYDHERNVAFGVSAKKPLLLTPGQSLVSVVSREGKKQLPTLQTAAVLTCLGATPAPDAFRPPYVRGDKAVRYRAADLDYSFLQRLRPVGEAPSIESAEKSFERLWLDHFPEWPVRWSQPADNMPCYGREIAATVATALLHLNLDHPNAKKKDLYVRLVQVGIDLHGALRSGCRWKGLGGHASGRKLPILFAGKALGEPKMLGIGVEFVTKKRDQGFSTFFGEDTQTFYVEQTKPGVWNDGYGGYTKEHEGLPEFGFSHFDDPKQDNAKWDGDPYRRCCTANAWVGNVLAARMMGLQKEWNHPAWFDYVDRYMKVEHSEAWHRAWIPWHAQMWDKYREQF